MAVRSEDAGMDHFRALPGGNLYGRIVCQAFHVNQPAKRGRLVYLRGQLDRQDRIPRNSRTSSDR
jgi:hypothetical protein